ncbi:MAG TPA: hypothetical protein VFK92_02450 [Burkholderiales bacterium]|nr:hypothetical protein [Burkholderiales bacterium]
MGVSTATEAGTTLVLLSLGAALAGAPSEAMPEDIFDAEAGVFHDSNLSNAVSADDIVADTALTLAASGGYRFAPGDRDAFALTGDLRAAGFSRFHGMNSVALGGTASWSRKFGLGAFAPWARLSASLAGERYDESVRDGRRASVALRAGERLSERLQLSGGGSFERYRADNATGVVPGISGDAFSLLGRSLFARADYAFDDRWAGFAGVLARRGDVTASTRLNLQIFQYSSAIALDPAFGPDYIAYRISGATSWDFVAGGSLALGDSWSANLAVTRALTYAANNIEYQSTRINASVIYSF